MFPELELLLLLPEALGAAELAVKPAEKSVAWEELVVFGSFEGFLELPSEEDTAGTGDAGGSKADHFRFFE